MLERYRVGWGITARLFFYILFISLAISFRRLVTTFHLPSLRRAETCISRRRDDIIEILTVAWNVNGKVCTGAMRRTYYAHYNPDLALRYGHGASTVEKQVPNDPLDRKTKGLSNPCSLV